MPIVLLGVTLSGLMAAADMAVNRSLLEAGNTFLNFLSVYLLIRASKAYRQEVAPKVSRVEAKMEDMAQAVIPNRTWDGTERRCDD